MRTRPRGTSRSEGQTSPPPSGRTWRRCRWSPVAGRSSRRSPADRMRRSRPRPRARHRAYDLREAPGAVGRADRGRATLAPRRRRCRGRIPMPLRSRTPVARRTRTGPPAGTSKRGPVRRRGTRGRWPVAGAAIRHDEDAISRVSRLCVTDGADGAAVAELLDVLEALALEAGSTRIRLDSSAFLADAHVPWQRSGYGTGPPYDGNADVDVWVERTSTGSGRQAGLSCLARRFASGSSPTTGCCDRATGEAGSGRHPATLPGARR